MILKHIYRSIAICMFASALTTTITSCSKDDEGEIYVQLGETITDGTTGHQTDALVADDYVCYSPTSGRKSAYYIYSNIKWWTIGLADVTAWEWVEVWPKEGDKDGRFYIQVRLNGTGAPRSTTLHILSNGKAYRSFVINQD